MQLKLFSLLKLGETLHKSGIRHQLIVMFYTITNSNTLRNMKYNECYMCEFYKNIPWSIPKLHILKFKRLKCILILL